MTPISKPNRIRRQSLPDLVAEALRSRILSGELADGDVLVQETVASDFDVSRMPVREAFRQLEAAGLLRRNASRGAIVTSVPVDEIPELFDIRLALEPQALRHAMPMMTEATMAEARKILSLLADAYGRGDISSWGGLNWRFHECLYRPSRRGQTLEILSAVHMRTDRFIRLQLVLTRDFAEAEEEHRMLLHHAASGNAVAAEALLVRHITTAKQSLMAALERRAGA